MLPVGAACTSSPEAEAFVRFCYQRRRVGWPELYDEMCAVATRGLFRGMGHDALAEVGVGFSLFETPRLAQLVTRIVSEEQAARRAARAAMLEAMDASRPTAEMAAGPATAAEAPGTTDAPGSAEPPRTTDAPGSAEPPRTTDAPRSADAPRPSTSSALAASAA